MPSAMRLMRYPTIVFVGLTTSLEISSSIPSASEIPENRIEYREPDHLHFNQDNSMLEYAFLDVHSPVITGAIIPDQLPEIPLNTGSNRETPVWWAATPIGRSLASVELSRYQQSQAAARFRELKKARLHDPQRFAVKPRMHC